MFVSPGRDWSDLSKQTGHFVVNEILSGESKEEILENIHGKLREVKEAVHNGEIPMDLYYITKVSVCLSKGDDSRREMKFTMYGVI